MFFLSVLQFLNIRNLDQEAIGIVDRPKMLRFLLALKRSDGSFSLHDRGESDTRGSIAFNFNNFHEH